MRLVCCLVLVLGGLQLACALKVAAWNVQQFGPSKANLDSPSPRKAAILSYIAEVIRQYDVILIQEVIDNQPGQPVITALMNEVNRGPVPPQYASIFSDPLCRGTCSHKERYLYIYKMNTGSVSSSYQYRPVPLRNTFTRPPFVALFQTNTNPTLQFVLIPQHTSPRFAACREIDALVDVVHYVTYPQPSGWGPQNVLLLGDFNAAGTYVSGTDWEDIRLRTQTNDFHWLIDDNMNTALSRRGQTPYAYDRIVANTPMLRRVVVSPAGRYMAGPLEFDQQFGLPNDPTTGAPVPAKDISDHFLVEVHLQ